MEMAGHEIKDTERIKYPLTLDEFLKANIPPVEYIIKPVLPKKGKLLITAWEGAGKTFFILNLACAIASGISPYLEEIVIKKKRILCIIGEGGEAELKRRLELMATLLGIDKQNLILVYKSNLDIFNADSYGFTDLSSMIEEAKAEVLILDPITQFWSGSESDKEEVTRLTKLFDRLIEKYQLAVIITHHWKKPTPTANKGGHMASGSHWWTAWADGHITLKGTNVDNIAISIEKVRSGIKPKEKLNVRLRAEDFWFEFIGKEGVKITDGQLDEMFNSFGSDRVKLVDLANRARENGLCKSRNTLESIIDDSKKYDIDASDPRCFYIIKKVVAEGVK